MTGKRYEVVIIGAGPAGAAAARALTAAGMQPVVIDKKKLPRQKMCSGILSHWTVAFVHRKFGPIPPEVYGRPYFLDGVTLHFPSLDEPVMVPALEPIPNVWRSRFDQFLVESSGAEIRDGHELERLETDGDGFRVTCRRHLQSGRTSEVVLKARYVVAADGVNSRSLKRFLPAAVRGLPLGTGMQVHYRGETGLDPRKYHVFFHLGMGFYAWSNVKDDDIHVGVGGIGSLRLPPCHSRFVSLLQGRYGLKIREKTGVEGMAGVLQGPLGVFTLGRGNFLVAGDAAGFVHNGGEGISCALATGELAAEAILRTRGTDRPAFDVYRDLVRPEVELCLDQFNPLRVFSKSPMKMDFNALWRHRSPGQLRSMWKDLKAHVAQEYGLAGTGVGRVARRNLVYHLQHGRYPVSL